jgi:diadenosine tetraphosphate (Ap4A) HIT family hydrolase
VSVLLRSVRLRIITARTATSVGSKDGLKTGSELLDSPIPGGYVVEGEHFLVEHAPLQESSAGTVIVEARRHLLDFGEMAPAESAELGSILHRLVPAIKAATEVQRVYFLAVMERAPHFHLWLVPKKNEGELRGAGYLAQQPPLTASYSAAEAMSGKIREQFEQS